MSLLRSKERASTKGTNAEVIKLEKAFIVTAEDGQKMINTLAELPIKYSSIIGPMIDALQKAYRGDVNVTITPDSSIPEPEHIPPPPPLKKVEK